MTRAAQQTVRSMSSMDIVWRVASAPPVVFGCAATLARKFASEISAYVQVRPKLLPAAQFEATGGASAFSSVAFPVTWLTISLATAVV